MNKLIIILVSYIAIGCQNTPIDTSSNYKDANALELIRYKGDELSLHFPNGIQLADLLKAFESFTNCSFVLDENMAKRKIIIIRQKPILPNEFPAFINSLLYTHQLALYPISSPSINNVTFKVISIFEMHSQSHPLFKQCELAGAINEYQWGTCIFEIKHIKSNLLVGVVLNISSTPKSVLTLSFPDKIAVTDNIMHLRKISQLISELDVESK